MAGSKSKKRKSGNKPHGHYCYVCGEHKANEKFTGHGHAHHICKKCQSLPVTKRNEMIAARKESSFRFSIHDDKPKRIVEPKTPVRFSELDETLKAEAIELLGELIGYFFIDTDHIPSNKDRDRILSSLCENMSESLNQWEPMPFSPAVEYYDPRFDFDPDISFDERIAFMKETLDAEAEDFDPYAEPEEPEPEPQKEFIVDDTLRATFDEIVASIIREYKADGIVLPTYEDTLTIAETERLKLRRFYSSDLDALYSIMQKPEVMYAWEHGFNRKETRQWMNRQLTRYHKDGYGYYAAFLKDSDRLIGQAGLIKSELNGAEIIEIGYIFDDSVWGQGYAVEAARACVYLAFHRFGIEKLYATIRPENEASVKVAVKLGMKKVGQYIKTYRDKEMSHDIYLLENINDMIWGDSFENR